MKSKAILIIAALFAVAAFADTPTPAPAAKPADPQIISVIDYNRVSKERDDLKAQIATVIPQYQQQNQYLQVLSERNELAVRLVQQQLTEATGKIAALQKELDDLKAKDAAKVEPPKK